MSSELETRIVLLTTSSSNGAFIGDTRVTGTAVLPQSREFRLHSNGPIVSVHVAKSAETLVG